jgi:hypothetical protein
VIKIESAQNNQEQKLLDVADDDDERRQVGIRRGRKML